MWERERERERERKKVRKDDKTIVVANVCFFNVFLTQLRFQKFMCGVYVIFYYIFQFISYFAFVIWKSFLPYL